MTSQEEAPPAVAAAATPATTDPATTEVAILAGGCFWGMQELIRKMPGVLSTRVG